MDSLGLSSQPLFLKKINEVNPANQKSNLFQNRKLRFKRAVRRLILLLKAFKIKKNNSPKLKLFTNPIFRMYLMVGFMWVYLIFVVYYRMIFLGALEAGKSDGFLPKYQCFFSNDECFNKEFKIWIFLTSLTGVFWILATVGQVGIYLNTY